MVGPIEIVAGLLVIGCGLALLRGRIESKWPVLVRTDSSADDRTDSSADDQREGFSPRHFVAALLLIVAAAAVLLISAFTSGLACSGDNSQCARTSTKNGVYEAKIVAKDSTPVRDQEILVHFPSRTSGFQEDAGVAFHTDGNAEVCIQWADEPYYPHVTTLSDAPLFSEFNGHNQYLAGTEGKPRAYLGGWRDLEGQNPPAGCQSSDAGIPWYRADDAAHQWQAKLLNVLPFCVIVVALVALIDYRHRLSRRLLTLGWLLLGVDVLTFLVLWNRI